MRKHRPAGISEGKARNLGDDVINARLESYAGGGVRDVVLEFVEQAADGELGGR